jgi:hypothetical protein
MNVRLVGIQDDVDYPEDLIYKADKDYYTLQGTSGELYNVKVVEHGLKH